MCHFSPASRLEAVGIYFRISVDKSIIALTLKRKDSMNDSEAFITQLCGTKFQLLQACLRAESSTFWNWHCLRKIALESKRPIHTWWTWCQITWKIIFYPIQQYSNGISINNIVEITESKSLHSSWATPYIAREAKGSVRKGPARPLTGHRYAPRAKSSRVTFCQVGKRDSKHSEKPLDFHRNSMISQFSPFSH